MLRVACLLLSVVALPLALCSAVDAAPAPSYDRDVRPILSQRCFKCHGPAVQEGGLRLDVPDGSLTQLDSGSPAIVPGASAQSALIERVAASDLDLRMPPASEPAGLTEAQIDVLRRWIDAGAKYEAHWAYLPPVATELPEVRAGAWPRNAIDRFILARLESEGLSPAPEADRATLLRRVSLDLTGLPPTPDEAAAFLADDSPHAYELLVERLMASPQFGVRQAQAWLDLARYADSDGYAHDFPRSIWPYRDWVVDALNSDMPFDRFTIEQLAGDLLPAPTPAQLVATGLHRNTRINVEAGSDPEEYRVAAVMDRTATTAAIWLGSTLGCAQCHNHKFDPFTQQDYYQVFACFNQAVEETTTDASGKMTDVSPRMPVATPQFSARRALLEARIAADKSQPLAVKKQLEALTAATTLVMKDVAPPRATHIFLRGNPLTPGEQVEAGPPKFLCSPETLTASESAGASPMTRLDLARWLVDRGNPLTARVQVNRLWMHAFGRGLVATPEDFGAQGTPPTHPELLDWLAVEFMERGWSMKHVLRLIVTSSAYRQSSRASEATLARDPANELCGRASRLRLPAEQVRDNALAIAGLLTADLGGPPTQTAEMSAAADALNPYRRSLYAFWKRQALDDTFITFDAPSRDVSCPRRERTRSPLQALSLLNEATFVDAALGLARRSLACGASDDAERLRWAFRACVVREPSAAELEVLTALLDRRREAFAADPKTASKLLESTTVQPLPEGSAAETAAWTLVANVLLNLDETVTRE